MPRLVPVDYDPFTESAPAVKPIAANGYKLTPVDHDPFAEPEGRTIGGTVKDIGISLGKGVIGLGESAVGIGDILTGGTIGKALQQTFGYDPKKTHEVLSGLYSEPQKEAFAKVQGAEGFIPTAKAMIENPSTIGLSAVESAPSMLGAGGIGRGLIKAGLSASPLAAAAAGEALVSAGQSAEQIRQDTGKLTPKQVVTSIGSGAGTGAIALAGGRIAQKLGIADPDVLLAGGKVTGGQPGVIRRIVEGGISEGVFEELPQSMQEQVWLNAALDRPLMQDVPASGVQGMFAGGVMGGGANVLSSKRGLEKPAKDQGVRQQGSPVQPITAQPPQIEPASQPFKQSLGLGPQPVQVPAQPDTITRAAQRRQQRIDNIYSQYERQEADKERIRQYLGGQRARTIRQNERPDIQQAPIPLEAAPQRAGLTGRTEEEVLQPGPGEVGQEVRQPVQEPGFTERRRKEASTVITPEHIEALKGLGYDYDDIFLMKPRDADYIIETGRTPEQIDNTRLGNRAGQVIPETIPPEAIPEQGVIEKAPEIEAQEPESLPVEPKAKEPWEITRTEKTTTSGNLYNSRFKTLLNIDNRPDASQKQIKIAYKLFDAIQKGDVETVDKIAAQYFRAGFVQGISGGAGPKQIKQPHSIDMAIGQQAALGQQLLKEHRSTVKKALSENKPVPPEVLKDYPDLASPPSTETAEPPKVNREATPQETPRAEAAPAKTEPAKPRQTKEEMLAAISDFFKGDAKPGKAWIDNQQRPIYAITIPKGKRNIGKVLVTLSQGKRVKIKESDIIERPQEAKQETQVEFQKRIGLSPAIKLPDGKIITGLTHSGIFSKMTEEQKAGKYSQGWVEKTGKWLTDEQARKTIAKAELPGTPKKEPVAIKETKPTTSKVVTLRGMIKKLGRINPLNFKGEVNDWPPAAKRLTKKTGLPIDLMEQSLKDEGWLRPDESLLELLRTDKEALKRGKVAWEMTAGETGKKTAFQKQQEVEQMKEFEPNEPPGEASDYVQMNVDELPEGLTLTIIEGRTPDGWDEYKVIKTKEGVTLKDGRTLKMEPWDVVEVLKSDLPKTEKQPGKKPKTDEILKEALRWQGAHINAEKEFVERNDKGGQYQIAKTSGKSELDTYLIKKFGIERADAHEVSNDITARNLKPDTSAKADDFKGEEWADFAISKKEKPKYINETPGAIEVKTPAELSLRQESFGKQRPTPIGEAVSKKNQESLGLVVEDRKQPGLFGKKVEPAETAEEAKVEPAFSRRTMKHVDVESPEFKEWFGASKVVDAEGKPLRVYHGTKDAFDAFDKKYLGKNTQHPSSRWGFAFTSDIEYAKGYSYYDSDFQKIVPVYLSVKNPKILSFKEYAAIAEGGRSKTYKNNLIEEGYDGIFVRPPLMPNESPFYERYKLGFYEIFVFEPTQIKSAISNTGAFSLTDPRIQFQKRTIPETTGKYPKNRLEKIIARRTRGWTNKPEIQVVEKQSELPQKVLDAIGPQDIVDAVLYQGTAYLVAENLGGPKHALNALFHESFGEYGLRLLESDPNIGPQYKAFENGLLKTEKAEIEKVAKEYDLDLSNPREASIAAKEYLSREAAKEAMTSPIRRLIRLIARWLNKIAPTFKLQKEEVRQWLRDARRMVETGEVGGAMAGEPAFTSSKMAEKWHSQMTNFLSEKLPGKGTGKSYLDTINSWAKKGLIKQEELEWSGLTEWLPQQENVTKQAVMDFLAANNVQVQEVEKGKRRKLTEPEMTERIRLGLKGKLSKQEKARYDELSAAELGMPTKFEQYQLPGGENYRELLLTLPGFDFQSSHWDEKGVLAHVRFSERYGPAPFVKSEQKKPTSDSLARDAETLSNLVESEPFISKGLRGLDVESQKSVIASVVRSAGDTQITGRVVEFIPVDVMDQLVRSKLSAEDFLSDKTMLTDSLSGNLDATIKFRPSAISAFIRATANLTTEEALGSSEAVGFPIQRGVTPGASDVSVIHKGHHILFIEEIQSDIHQKGRKEGYKGDYKPLSAKEKAEINNELLRISRERDVAYQQKDAEKLRELEAESTNLQRKLLDSDSDRTVPDAPFKKTWPLLAMKRMVRYAAENGFDSIAWTPGDVQAERYDLSKQVDAINYTKKRDGSYYLRVIKDGANISQPAGIPESIAPEDLEKYVGKDVAQKIVGGGDKGELSGIDLKVGGAGMIGFYDKILPAEVNKFFNKAQWGNAKVGTVDLGGVNQDATPKFDSDTVKDIWPSIKAWSLPITPEMKQKALREGMPLFQKEKSDTLSPMTSKKGPGITTEKQPQKPEGGTKLYHGTWQPIDGIKDVEGGFFATTDKDFAFEYTNLRASQKKSIKTKAVTEEGLLRAFEKTHGKNKKVYDVSIDLKRPLDLRGISTIPPVHRSEELFNLFKTSKEKYLKAAKKAYGPHARIEDIDDVAKWINKEVLWDNNRMSIAQFLGEMKHEGITPRIKKFIEDLGYDGIIFDDVVKENEFGTNIRKAETYVAFNKDQIEILPNPSRQAGEPGPEPAFSRRNPLHDDTEFVKDIEYFAGNFKESKPDTTLTDRIASLPIFHFNKVPALKGMLDAGLDWMDDKVRILRDLIYNSNGEAYNAKMDTFRKQRKDEWEKWNQRFIENDVNATGYSVKQDEDDPGTWILRTPENKEVGRFKDDDEAWEKARKLERSDYLTNSWASEQGADALEDFRLVTRNIYKQYKAGVDRLIQKYKERQEDPPTITYRTEEGNAQISLEAAIAKMGDRQGYYVPRLRPSGRLVLIAKKSGENPIRKNFDLGIMNPEKSKVKGVLNYPAPIMRESRRLKRKGYEVTIEKSDKMPEDVFLNLAGQRIAMSAIINKGLEGVSRAAHFKLSDIGLNGKWSTRRKATTEYKVNGRWVDESSLSKEERKGKETREIKEGESYYEITGSPTKNIYRDILEDLGGDFYYKSGKGRGTPAWVFRNASENIEEQIKEMIFETTGINQDLDLIFAGEIANQIATIEKSRGSLARTIGRSDATGEDVWKGYEEDTIIALTKTAQAAAGGEAKRILAERMVKLMTGTTETWQEYKERLQEEGGKAKWADYKAEVDERRIDPTRQGNAYKEGMSYMENLLRNDEAADRVLGTVKGLAVLKYLGFRVAAPAVNLTALMTTVPATMAKNGIPLRKVPKYLGRAMKAYHSYRKGESTGDWKIIFDTIDKNGWHKSQYNKEALSVLKTSAGRKWDNFLEASMWMFGVTEQLNRIATIAGSAKAFQDKGMDIDKALLKAKEDVSDKAHGVYGKANLPFMARGGGIGAQVIRSFYVFRTFSHHYILNLKEMVGEGQYKAAAFMTLSPAILAGAGASVLTPIVSAIGKMFGFDDPEEEFYRWAQDSFGNDTEGLLRTGLAGLAGVNMKGSLAIGITDVPTSFKDLLGAPGSMVSDFYEGGKSIFQGRFLKGLEKATPVNALGSMIKSVRESEGVTTGKDAPVFYGKEQLKPSVLDSIVRFFSFNPAEISTKREKQWKEKKVSYDYQEKRSDIYSKIKRFYSLPQNKRTRGRWADILVDIEEYNEKSRRAITYVPKIDNKSIKRMLYQLRKPPKRERMRK